MPLRINKCAGSCDWNDPGLCVQVPLVNIGIGKGCGRNNSGLCIQGASLHGLQENVFLLAVGNSFTVSAPDPEHELNQL
jgi:hypothetical protein